MFTSVTYFFLFLFFFFISPQISEPANGRLVGILRTVEGMGQSLYPVTGFFALSRYFRGGGKIAPNFARNLMMPSFAYLS